MSKKILVLAIILFCFASFFASAESGFLPVTRIQNELSDSEFSPSENIKAAVFLFDWLGYPIIQPLNVKIFNPENKIIFDATAESGSEIEYTLGMYASPGEYTFVSSVGDTLQRDTFKVEKARKIKSVVQGGNILIKNIGNVEFNDEVEILLQNGGKTYTILNKLILGPGDSAAIALSKELPEGNYDISIPNELLEGETELNPGEKLVLNGIFINDERPISTKVSQGISLITGAYLGTGAISSRPHIASILLVVAVVSIALFYSREPLKRIMSGGR